MFPIQVSFLGDDRLRYGFLVDQLRAHTYLGGGFKHFNSPQFGEDSHFDLYFSDGLKPPTRYDRHFLCD